MLALFCIVGFGNILILEGFLSQNWHSYQIFESSLEVQRVKRKFSDNPGHNILPLFNNLAQVQVATGKTILDI